MKAANHPLEEDLLRYLDGELKGRAARGIRKHLEACWQCRVELDELQKTVAACVRYKKSVLEGGMPAPPAPWPDLYRQFAEIDRAAAGSGWRRVGQALRPRRSVPVAAAVAIACLLFYRFRQTPSVEAAELLRRAVAAADARPVKVRRIEIRTKDRRVTRVTGLKVAPGGRRRGPASQSPDPLQAMFQEARYDWDDPLSARAYLSWHDRLARKRDLVTEARETYRIQTSTQSGELTQATLTLRTADLRPVEERLEFRNHDWVEISELAAAVPADAGEGPESTIAKADTPRRPAAPAPASGGLAQPGEPATVGDELHVIAALDRVGADLGDPIEVSRAGSEILVAGVGIAPQRQQEIRSALGSQPRVAIHFSEPAPAAAPAETVRGPAAGTGSPALEQLQARMAEQMGGRANFTQVASEVLDSSEAMMARAYALHRLAERFPAAAEAELSQPDLGLLAGLRSEHTAELRKQVAGIEGALRPMLAQTGGTRPPAQAPEANWQAASGGVLESARRVEKLLAVLFGFTGAADGPAGDQLRQLAASLAELDARLDVYSRAGARSRN